MTGNYFTLKLLAKRLNELLRGRLITGVFSQERDELVIAIGAPAIHLIISCRPGENTLFLHPGYERARSNTADLMQAACDAAIREVRVSPGDRVVSFQLDGDRALVCQFFGARANVLLVDRDGHALDSFRKARAGETVRPEGDAQAPMFDSVRLRELLAASPDHSVVKVLRQALPQLGPELAREAAHRAGLADDAPAGAATPAAVNRLIEACAGLLDELNTPRPVVYGGAAGSPPLFSPVLLHSLAENPRREYDDIHEAVRTTVYRRRALLAADRERTGILDTLHREIDRLDRAIRSLDEGGAEHGRADLYERYGEMLLARPGDVPRGAAAVDIEEGSERHVIELDPRISATRNAQRYFERAKRARTARAEAARRRPPLIERRARALQLMEDVGQLRSRDELKAYAASHGEELTDFGIGPKAREREQIPFRTFTVDGGFEVWAGKSSENNDLLTLRHAKPNDLWFHARGAGGSHVVLRVGTGGGEPGKLARQEAASVAAYYSKMRNAGMVPVAMTRKKFVRKPRGAPAGTVVLEREEVIFVPPRLPGGEPGLPHKRRADRR